jgi:hypothetical protein
MESIKSPGLFSDPRLVKKYDFELKKKVIDRILGGESVPAPCVGKLEFQT